MPGQRGTYARRSRGSWAVRIAGIALVLVAAGTAASFLVFGRAAAHPRRHSADPLPSNVISPMTIGLVNPGPPPRQNSRPVSELLYLSATGLAFTASGGQAAPAQEWTADQMGGGTYILIYVPDSRCLTVPAGTGRPAVTLARCNLSLSQRWLHQLGKNAAGQDSYRLRSAANGLCVTAVRPPLGASPGESGVSLRACGPSVTWRQVVSFQATY
jgi:hypothetical protein